VARDQLVGAAHSAERRDLPGRPDLGADLIDAVRGAPLVTPPAALVIVPTFNERDNLPVLLEALMLQPNVSVLVVDDQAPDGPGEGGDAIAAAHPGRSDVMHRTVPPGLGRSYIDGIASALERPVDVI